jgi:hypothetical protein
VVVNVIHLRSQLSDYVFSRFFSSLAGILFSRTSERKMPATPAAHKLSAIVRRVRTGNASQGSEYDVGVVVNSVPKYDCHSVRSDGLFCADV